MKVSKAISILALLYAGEALSGFCAMNPELTFDSERSEANLKNYTKSFTNVLSRESLSSEYEVEYAFNRYKDRLTNESEKISDIIDIERDAIETDDIAGFIIGCALSIPSFIEANEDDYATALHKASADLACIPVIGQLLGLADMITESLNQRKEIEEVNNIITALNNGSSLVLDDSNMPEHKLGLEVWNNYESSMNQVWSDIDEDINEHNKKINQRIEDGIAILLKNNYNSLSAEFFNDNSYFTELIEDLNKIPFKQYEIHREYHSIETNKFCLDGSFNGCLSGVIDDFMKRYKKEFNFNVVKYSNIINHSLVNEKIRINNNRNIYKDDFDNKKGEYLSSASSVFDVFKKTSLAKISEIRDFEYRKVNNIDEDGRKEDTDCWQPTITCTPNTCESKLSYVCEYYKYNADEDYGVGGYVYYKEKIETKHKELLEYINHSNIDYYIDLQPKMVNKYYLNEDLDIQQISNTLTGLISSDAYIGDYRKYSDNYDIIHEYLDSNEFLGKSSKIYSRIFEHIKQNIDQAGSRIGSLGYLKPLELRSNYILGQTYAFPYTNSAGEGNLRYYRNINEYTSSMPTSASSTKDWEYLGTTDILTGYDVSFHAGDIVINEKKELYQRVKNDSYAHSKIPEDRAETFVSDWNYIGTEDNLSDVKGEINYWNAIKYSESKNYVPGDIVYSYSENDNSYDYYILAKEIDERNITPSFRRSNFYWRYLPGGYPKFMTNDFGSEGYYGKGGLPFVALYPVGSENKRLIISHGNLIDSIQLEWFDPDSQTTKRSLKFGGEGGVKSTFESMGVNSVMTYQDSGFASNYVTGLKFSLDNGLEYNFGNQESKSVAKTIDSCNIEGIHGRSGNYIDSLGFYNNCGTTKILNSPIIENRKPQYSVTDNDMVKEILESGKIKELFYEYESLYLVINEASFISIPNGIPINSNLTISSTVEPYLSVDYGGIVDNIKPGTYNFSSYLLDEDGWKNSRTTRISDHNILDNIIKDEYLFLSYLDRSDELELNVHDIIDKITLPQEANIWDRVVIHNVTDSVVIVYYGDREFVIFPRTTANAHYGINYATYKGEWYVY